MKKEEKIIIFVAEDDSDDQQLLQEVLKSCFPHCRVQLFANGQRLLEGLAAVRQLPSLIFLDLNMPVMDGFATLSVLKTDNRLRTIPAVVLSTSDNPADIKRSYILGSNAYLTKPDSQLAWLNLLKQTQQYWTEIVRLPNTVTT